MSDHGTLQADIFLEWPDREFPQVERMGNFRTYGLTEKESDQILQAAWKGQRVDIFHVFQAFLDR